MSLLDKLPGRLQLAAAWAIAIGLLLPLGWLRLSTEAEYAFASAIIVPVLLVAWAGGFAHGVAASVLAACMWIAGDLFSGREWTKGWIPYVNGAVRLATYCLIAFLAARIRELLRELAAMATKDSLTGLMNQRAFFEAGQAEALRASRYGHPMAVVFLDLDDFKILNDTLGHDAGNDALVAVGKALTKALRSTDSVARLGGDEFAVLLHEIDEQSAVGAARKMSEKVEAALEAYPPVSASIGVVWYERPRGRFKSMLKAADAQMYEVKHGGKGRFRVRRFAGKGGDAKDHARTGARKA